MFCVLTFVDVPMKNVLERNGINSGTKMRTRQEKKEGRTYETMVSLFLEVDTCLSATEIEHHF